MNLWKHRPFPFLVLLLGFVLEMSGPSAHAKAPFAPPFEPLQVLFLGDNQLHQPKKRFDLVAKGLFDQGIQLVYTDRLEDLNPSHLRKFDVLIICANHPTLYAEQEKALLGFVDAGKGLVAIHCATACFYNSKSYIDLVGAQFKTHGAGVFRETIVDPTHPITRGLKEIQSWDETYEHHLHNTNRLVLAERRTESHVEPYTWIRNHGKGRVFYTAWGHDERTWSHPDFQRLLVRGVRWAGGKNIPDLTPHKGLAPFEYVDAEVPFYDPVRDPRKGTSLIRQMQKPLSPEASSKHLVNVPEFETKLWASEPQIKKPIAMAFDAKGRLWIAETVDYPNELQIPGKGRDRILICEDTNDDGQADKFTVFADNLSIPTALLFSRGGVIVMQAPDVLFLKDTNGDDKADTREVLFSGWGTFDTHAGPSNIRWGFDNSIWGVVGYSGFEGVVNGGKLRFAMGFYRFSPDGKKLEFLRSSNNNTWGFGWSEDGMAFGSTANGNPSMYLPIPNRYYETVFGWSASRVDTIATSRQVFPITDKVRQVDAHGGYTAAAGHTIYTARHFPRAYWNHVAFVCEPTAHLVGQFQMMPEGGDFTAKNNGSFLASDDEWTAPVATEIGPDGALWVLDWYNYIIQHNPTPTGFVAGKHGAYETPLRDKTHGRIYRVTHKHNKLSKPLNLTDAPTQELVAALKNDNLLWRMHAQRLLVEKGGTRSIPALIRLVKQVEVDESGQNAAALHAVWTLHGLGALEGAHKPALAAVISALNHPAWAVRRAALMVVPRSEALREELLKQSLMSDAHAQVRMAAFLAFSEMPPSEKAGSEIWARFLEEQNHQDRWIPDAVTAAAARHDHGFLKGALQTTHAADSPEIRKVIRIVSEHYVSQHPDNSMLSLLYSLKGSSKDLVHAVLDGFNAGWPQGASLSLAANEVSNLADLMKALPVEARGRLVALANRWGRHDMFATQAQALADEFRSRMRSDSLSEKDRIDAARQLILLDDTVDSVTSILVHLTPTAPPGLSTGLIQILTESRLPATASAVLQKWSDLTPVTRRAALSMLVRRPEWIELMIAALEGGTVSRTDIPAEYWQQIASNSNSTLVERAKKIRGAQPSATSGELATLVERIVNLSKEKGDAILGKKVFESNCMNCHLHEAAGGKIGPELSGIEARAPSDILLDVLDPNRSVEANFRVWTATNKEGESFSGLLQAETQTTIELLDLAGHVHVVQRRDLAELRQSQLSIMPSGFEQLPVTELANLLAFLTRQGKTP